MADARIAAEITVEGVVQGVGFREFTRRHASLLGLAGHVANLADGRVRVHAEGAREAIEALARELERGPRLARVRRVSIEWRAPTGRATTFTIAMTEPAT